MAHHNSLKLLPCVDRDIFFRKVEFCALGFYIEKCDSDGFFGNNRSHNKAYTSDTEAPVLDLHLSISNGFVSSNIYDKRDDFDFDIVNDGDVPRRPSYGVYTSQLIRFARVFSHVDLNTRNKCLTAKLLKQAYQYHKLRKAFCKFYRRHNELISKFIVGLKSLLRQSLSEPEFYGD